MRLIDADALIDDVDGDLTDSIAEGKAIEKIMNAPTVDAVPVVHGRWKAVTDDGDEYKRICSCCGEYAPFDEFDDAYLLYPHCPWCGARMDGKDGDHAEGTIQKERS